MSIYIIQDNLQTQTQEFGSSQPLLFADAAFHAFANVVLIKTSNSSRSYIIIKQLRALENVQIYFQIQSDQKYLKFKIRPTHLVSLNKELVVDSLRSVVELVNRLQFLKKEEKFRFYKWHIDTKGYFLIEIIYFAKQFSNQFNAQFILGKTCAEVTQMLDLVIPEMLFYLNFENYATVLERNEKILQSEERTITLSDKVKHMNLLSQVYKKHRTTPNQQSQSPIPELDQSKIFLKPQTLSQTTVLVHSDAPYIEQLYKQKHQFEQKFKEIFWVFHPNLNQKTESLELTNMHSVHVEFKNYVKQVKREHLQIYETTSQKFRIVKGILKHELLGPKKLLSDGGAHSLIHLGFYSLQLADTLFTYEESEVSQEQTEKKVITKQLITKRVKSIESKESVNAMKNEVDFLYFFKDKTSKFIATYFLPLAKEKQELQEIFVEYYQSNLKEYLQKKKKETGLGLQLIDVLAIAENVLLALIFLVQNSVLHRDLKPYNVMIDENMKGRLIDFGSCCPINNGSEFEVSEKRLLTTKTYQIQYQQCVQQIRCKYRKYQYEQHILYDIYSFGQTLKEMVEYVGNVDQLGSNQNIKISEIFQMMISKCKEQDPVDRITFDELLFFIKVLKDGVSKKSVLLKNFK